MSDNINYEFDIYTEIDRDIGAVGITHAYSSSDHGNPSVKKRRESKFPLDRILQATNVDVKQAEASVESDRTFILNTITGRSVDDQVVDDYHDKYVELNNIMRGIFVAPVLERIIKEKDEDTIIRCLEIVKASNSRIINLNLIRCSRFDDDILIKLVDSLPLTLTYFRLESNKSSVTVNRMNTCLKKIVGIPQLVRLDLLSNNIDDDGAKQIADALEFNNSLEELNLFMNKIGAFGAEAIANAIKVKGSLVELGMSYNNIGDDGAKAIADALKDIHSLKTLNLDHNNIGDDGATAIADALSLCLMQENHSLKSLYLFSNNISADVKEYLKLKSVNRNRKISIFC